MRLLLTKVAPLDKDGQYVEIKVRKSKKTKQIKYVTTGEEKKVLSRMLISIANLAAQANLSISLFLKDDN